MALTLSDRNRMMYMKYRSEGLTHEQALNKFPGFMRKIVEQDLNKTFCESHFGMKFSLLCLTIGGFVVVAGIVVYMLN